MSQHDENRSIHFRSALFGGMVAALVALALPAVAAEVGDALTLGEANRINARSTLRGKALANLVIINEAAGDTDGTALDLRVRAGNAPFRVNSSDLVVGLNSDLLDSRHANELTRVAYARSAEVDESIFIGGAADILTATITAPGPGLLVISASVDASGATDDQYTCQIQVDDSVVTGSIRTSRVNWAGVGHTDNTQENCSTDAVQPVAAGEYVLDFRVIGRNTAAFHSATLWALWTPFDGEGTVPIP